MIASWEGKITPGSTSDLISAFWDVMPTLAEVAGVEAPQGIDGISFLPELMGENGQTQHEFLYWEFPSYQGQQAVRLGDWKGIRKNIFEGNMEIELYNLKIDPAEQQNVAPANPEVVKQIEKIMKQEHTEAEIEKFKIEQLGDIKESDKKNS